MNRITFAIWKKRKVSTTWQQTKKMMVLVAIVMMPRVCGSGNDGRVPWRGLITLECRITTAREETSNLPPPDPSGTDGIGKCLTPTPTNINLILIT